MGLMNIPLLFMQTINDNNFFLEMLDKVVVFLNNALVYSNL